MKKQQHIIYPPATAELIDQFRNEVLHREEGSQAKAKSIWKALYHLLTETETREINIEWQHYWTGELSTEDFGNILKRIAAKYRTI